LLNDFLPLLSKILIGIMTLSKMFLKQLKLSLIEDKNIKDE